MNVHIVGVCGTFMGGIARLAKDLGHRVSGSDANVYPPMSTQLIDAGIELINGFSADNLPPDTELVVIGNALSRGNPEIEATLAQGLPYTSGPQFLAEHVLVGRWV
ncbi:MAG: Mur ligase domain-containing protein, partial [Pseudomonadota bacterium]